MTVKAEDIVRGKIAVIEVEILSSGVDWENEIEVRHSDGDFAYVGLADVVAVKDAPYKPEVGHVVQCDPGASGMALARGCGEGEMREHQGLPVSGYRPQSADKVALVNEHKQMEERLLRHMERLLDFDTSPLDRSIDQRWVAIAKSHFEQGFMCLNRAVFQPARVSLPEDEG